MDHAGTVDETKAPLVGRKRGHKSTGTIDVGTRFPIRDTLVVLARNAPVFGLGLVATWTAWLLLSLDRVMLAATLDNGFVSSWLETACRVLSAAAVGAQVAVCVLLIGGLLQAAQESLTTGRRARLRSLVVPTRQGVWLLVAAAIAAVPVVTLVSAAQSGNPASLSQPYQWAATLMQRTLGDTALGVLAPVAIMVVAAALAVLAPTLPLIVDRDLNPIGAIAASARLSATRMRLRHVPVAWVSAAGLLVCCAIATWGVSVNSENAIGEGPAGTVWFVAHLPWTRVAAIAVPTLVAAAVAATLGAVYCRHLRPPANEDANPTTMQSTGGWAWMAAGATALLIVTVGVALALGAILQGSTSTAAPPGARVALPCGLSYVPPQASGGADVTTYRRWPDWLPCGQNVRDAYHPRGIGGAVESTTIFGAGTSATRFFFAEAVYSAKAYWLLRAETYSVFGRSADGLVTLRWAGPSFADVYVVTHIPGKMTGVIRIIVEGKRGHHSPRDIARAWRELRVEGVDLPLPETQRSPGSRV
jgi:hypothetical protein